MSIPLVQQAESRPVPFWKMLVSGLIFEGIWLLCVLDPSTLLVVGFTLLNFAFHLFLFHSSALSQGTPPSVYRSILWLISISVAGIAMDAILFRTGIFISEPSPTVVPLWLACLWLNFALAVRYAFVFLHGKLWLSAVFGFFGGPLSYLIGAKIGGEVALATPLWLTLLVLGLLWCVFLPMIIRLLRVTQPPTLTDSI
ncbi:DUF2878 domain-containing protein [Microbulbifer agarilyticus]|uniref:DUF2878 domain-containing protein n=1 Tax=Microbulbifer agarilyticus TaxID=260552 RepID=UPI001C975401|nr:DUF2878 domain-containing protein [Microbulbifer agarilyticus]MBY6210789.1 DUF2878 domain-containing protein [Microbulbifer agarilyticus]MCA0892008.1 DUF2878 domain-containing protein [Microbulbifer agarilyticus]